LAYGWNLEELSKCKSDIAQRLKRHVPYDTFTESQIQSLYPDSAGNKGNSDNAGGQNNIIGDEDTAPSAEDTPVNESSSVASADFNPNSMNLPQDGLLEEAVFHNCPRFSETSAPPPDPDEISEASTGNEILDSIPNSPTSVSLTSVTEESVASAGSVSSPVNLSRYHGDSLSMLAEAALHGRELSSGKRKRVCDVAGPVDQCKRRNCISRSEQDYSVGVRMVYISDNMSPIASAEDGACYRGESDFYCA
jgi:hypothetical protein